MASEAKRLGNSRVIARGFFPPWKGVTPAQRWAYFVVAALAFIAETSWVGAGNLQVPMKNVTVELMFASLLALAGGMGTRVEALYIAAFFISVFLGIGIAANIGTVGIYVLCTSWIVRRWFIPSLFLFLGAEAVQFPVMVSQLNWTTDRFIRNALFSGVIICAVGFSLYLVTSQAARLRNSVARYRAIAEEAEDRVRHEIASELHNSTARDLARLALTAQELSNRGHATPEELDMLTKIAIDASKHVRPLVLGIDSRRASATIANAVSDAVPMLEGRSIALHVAVLPDIDTRISRGQRLAGALLIREGSTNILKYAPAGSEASLEVMQVGENGALSLIMASAIANEPDEATMHRAHSSGYGLANLAERVADEGGTLQFGPAGDQWILCAVLPSMKETFL